MNSMLSGVTISNARRKKAHGHFLKSVANGTVEVQAIEWDPADEWTEIPSTNGNTRLWYRTVTLDYISEHHPQHLNRVERLVKKAMGMGGIVDRGITLFRAEDRGYLPVGHHQFDELTVVLEGHEGLEVTVVDTKLTPDVYQDWIVPAYGVHYGTWKTGGLSLTILVS